MTQKPEDKDKPHPASVAAATEAAATAAGRACPHCGHKLSPWQQVLLSVDRALVCRNCWYRIILGVTEDGKPDSPPPNEE